VRLLALDTTTANGSVALLEDEEVRGETRTTSESHSQWLVPALPGLVAAAGWSMLDIDAYAVAAGPGSFTGLRVGLSTVQGLAMAAGRPCLGVTTLEALAYLARRSADIVVALVDAFRGEVFYGRYDAEGRATGPHGVGGLERALEGLAGRVAFVGDGAVRYRTEILARYPQAVLLETEPFLAVPVGRLALPRLQEGRGMAPGALRPVYLREAHIRKPAP
jgi:tRNA threonylcarbamoyladenosine biosynthesis protein TsaB